jgi:hypothetical protein
VLDDDDFSVAPSLATEMQIVSESSKTKFDDVYRRGKKVSIAPHCLFPSPGLSSSLTLSLFMLN